MSARPVLAFCLAGLMPVYALEVDLIGTGGPELTPDRAGAATLVTTGDEMFLFDAGRGVLQGIYRAGVSPKLVTRIFLTHLHNDHIEGLPALWMTPWFLLRRERPLEIWGPPGTKAMVAGMREMFAHDLAQRPNGVLKREFLDITIHEISAGVVYSAGGVTISAIVVEHNDGNPAFAYRVQAETRAVLLTGDTTLTEPLREAAKGTALIVCNVVAGTAELEASGAIAPILNKLMRPEQAAQLFLAGQPGLAVYSHIVKKKLPGVRGDEVILQRTRRAGYKGRLLMGKDGMRIVLGQKIDVLPAPPLRSLPELDGAGAIF